DGRGERAPAAVGRSAILHVDPEARARLAVHEEALLDPGLLGARIDQRARPRADARGDHVEPREHGEVHVERDPLPQRAAARAAGRAVELPQRLLLGIAGHGVEAAGNPKQQTLRQFNGTTGCTGGGALGQWVSLNVNFPVFPWFHMVATSIGTWTSPLVYPGTEQAWVEEGFFVHREPCTGFWVDMKYGASTYGGWGAFTAAVGPVKGFTDLADNYSAPVGGPYPTPLLGSVRPTDRLIYVNQ